MTADLARCLSLSKSQRAEPALHSDLTRCSLLPGFNTPYASKEGVDLAVEEKAEGGYRIREPTVRGPEKVNFC